MPSGRRVYVTLWSTCLRHSLWSTCLRHHLVAMFTSQSRRRVDVSTSQRKNISCYSQASWLYIVVKITSVTNDSVCSVTRHHPIKVGVLLATSSEFAEYILIVISIARTKQHKRSIQTRRLLFKCFYTTSRGGTSFKCLTTFIECFLWQRTCIVFVLISKTTNIDNCGSDKSVIAQL